MPTTAIGCAGIIDEDAISGPHVAGEYGRAAERSATSTLVDEGAIAGGRKDGELGLTRGWAESGLPYERLLDRLMLPLTVTKLCVRPELLVMPAPSTNRTKPHCPGLAVIVKAVAPNIPDLNTMLATSVVSEMEIPCTMEVTKVAVSPGPGTVAGDQLPGKPQLSSWGKLAQVALPAKALLVAAVMKSKIAAALVRTSKRFGLR